MSAAICRKFLQPEFFHQVDPEVLNRWLQPARDCLRVRGVHLTEPGAAGGLDLDRLALVFLEPPPDFPENLLESIWLVRELASEEGMDAILRIFPGRGCAFDPGSRPTPAEVAIRAWLVNPALLEEVHLLHERTRPRAFQYFSTNVSPVPAFTGLTPERLAGLERRLNGFHEAWQRGRGTRVFVVPEAGSWWFLVRHGLPWRREATLEEGRPEVIIYRPRKHDVVVYQAERGELRINCCSQHERNVLLRAFGIHLFDNPDFFPNAEKYTLAPLLTQGRACLYCWDVPGLEAIHLTGVEFFAPGTPSGRHIYESNDIFEHFQRENIKWPGQVEAITGATFRVKFHGNRSRRRLTIRPCNRAIYSRDGDGFSLEAWMLKRGWMR